ncbi:uncharacterized protein LOC125227588 [Leguminivora glycinivorella]|uniref:uncharacterized protein LOC125227588 n=1 Tax=Leguminivora glycinivorella TaxID=1035111 RepID=UPI00200F7AA0|nr:uncharacterized protein LOC125227588 [Leguminivora glycinivorella]
MSPLACSLLALGTLLAAADAVYPITYCGFLELGRVEDDKIEFVQELTVSGGIVNIPDKCTIPGRKLVGEKFTACNAPNYTPKIIQAFKSPIDMTPNFAMVEIDCPSDIDGCNTLVLEVVQYCQTVTGPH